jgi:hypothetical protein
VLEGDRLGGIPRRRMEQGNDAPKPIWIGAGEKQ